MATSPWAGMFALVVLAAAACGGGSDDTAATETPPPAKAAPSDSRVYATVGQYASIIAQSDADLQKSFDNIQECAVAYNVRCFAYGLTLSLQADTLLIKLDGAAKAGGATFIGMAPPEIASLVADTKLAARDVRDRYEAELEDCDESDTCETAYARFHVHDVSRLETQIAGWTPYL